MLAARRRAARLVVLIAPVAWGACTPEPGARAQMLLVASPDDGTSGLDGLAVGFALFSLAETRSAILARLMAATTLATWPDLTPLATEPANVVGSMDVRPGVKAVLPAPEGWYAAILPRLPSTLTAAPGNFHRLPDERLVVRVRVGSGPVLWSLDVCPTAGGATSVVVTFSELVHAATTSAMPLSLAAGPAAGPLDCKPKSPPPLVDLPNRTFEYVCPTTLGPKDVVSVAVATGLLSKVGVGVPAVERVAPLESLLPDEVVAGCAALVLGP